MLSRFVIVFFPRRKCLLMSLSAVTLEAKKIKSVTVSFFPFYLPRREGTGRQGSLFTLLVHPHQETLSSFSLSSIRVVSSTYLRPLIFLLATLVPAWDSLQLAFHMLSSACKLVKQDCDKQPCHTPFPIWNQSVVDS